MASFKGSVVVLKIKLTLLHSRTGLGRRNFCLEAPKGGAANTGDAQDVDQLGSCTVLEMSSSRKRSKEECSKDSRTGAVSHVYVIPSECEARLL